MHLYWACVDVDWESPSFQPGSACLDSITKFVSADL